MPIEASTRRSRMSMASMIATDYRIPQMQTALIALAAYLLGSISFAIVVSWLMRLPDPRGYGSKNPGATNVLRSRSKPAAVLTPAGDGGESWAAVLVSPLATAGRAAAAPAGVAPGALRLFFERRRAAAKAIIAPLSVQSSGAA